MYSERDGTIPFRCILETHKELKQTDRYKYLEGDWYVLKKYRINKGPPCILFTRKQSEDASNLFVSVRAHPRGQIPRICP